MSSKGNCFVIAPIGEEGTDTRKQSDTVFDYIISPPVESCGYVPKRADKISQPGMITNQVLTELVEAPLVLADLSGLNPNVFYELAIRHAIRKPVVQIVHKDEKLPFDVHGMRTIYFDHRDLPRTAKTKNEIVDQIKALEGKQPAEIDSPLSSMMLLKSLTTSSHSEQRTLAEILSAITQLRADIAAMAPKRQAFFPLQSKEDLARRERHLFALFQEKMHLQKKLDEMAANQKKRPQQTAEIEPLRFRLAQVEDELNARKKDFLQLAPT